MNERLSICQVASQEVDIAVRSVQPESMNCVVWYYLLLLLLNLLHPLRPAEGPVKGTCHVQTK